MNKKNPEILLTLDSMKDLNTGLYYFGKALAESLMKLNNGKFNFSYYVYNKDGFFKNVKVPLYKFHKIHKYIFPYKYKFDLVHITDQFCRLPPASVNGKTVLTIHDLNILHEPHRSQEYIDWEMGNLRNHIKKCDQVVAISNFVANDICKIFPEATQKVRVIYNGADKLSVSDIHVPKYVPKERFIFTLGPINFKKNFHVLPALLQDNDYELIISGITYLPEYNKILYNEAKKYNCENRIKLTGIVNEEDKAWYYKNCLAFAFPSLAEGFGLPVIEAMSFGKPVFLSNKTSLPEVGGDQAFYFENFDPAHMQTVFAEGMCKYTNSNMMQNIINRSDLFTWQNTARAYLNLYKELLV